MFQMINVWIRYSYIKYMSNFYLNMKVNWLIKLFIIVCYLRLLLYKLTIIQIKQSDYFMGNQESQTQTNRSSIQNIQNTQQIASPILDQQFIMVQLRMLLENVIKQFENFKEQLAQFRDQIKVNPNFKRGQDFQGRVNQHNQVYGIAKYFYRKDLDCNVYFGQCKNGIPVGRGINIKVKLIADKDNNRILDIHSYEALLLQNWQRNNQLQKGSVIKANKDTITYFKGKLRNQMFQYGTMIIKRQDIIKMKYQGQFKLNRIQGRGTLEIPGVYEYKGSFYRQQKSGFGWERDIIRQTEYIGQFQNGNRHGYGQLSYGKNRQDVKIKGFWTDGVIKSGEGMYVSKDGVFIEIIGDDIQLL